MKSPESGKTSQSWRHRFLVLGLILTASFAVRLAALKVWGTGSIESDGAEYARIAENLRKGVGYVGITTPGRELNYSPLFPLLISAASFVTGDFVWAGRLVSLVLGALLPLPVFGIASQLFGRRTGFVAALLTVLHPLLINLSFAVLSEGPYATLLLSGVYVVLRALNRSSTRMWSLVGGTFGLAYLVRPEAVAALLISVLFALTATQEKLAIRCKHAVAAIALFLALALPQITFIYKSTGKVRLDGKSAIVFAIGARILSAQAHLETDHGLTDAKRDEPSPLPNMESWQPWQDKWATNAINSDLEGTGIWMRPNADVIRESISLAEFARILERATGQSAPELLAQLSSKWLGAPFLPALAMLGALRRPWRRPLASSQLFVMLVPTTAVVATFAALWIYPRFYFVLVPFFLIWAANGLVEVGRWTKSSIAVAGWRWLSPGVLACIIPTLIGLGVVLYPINGVRDLYEFKQSSPSTRIVEQVGLWIGQQQNRQVKIMDLTVPLAFYANAQFVPFPYCSAGLALHFLDTAQVDYVILHRGERFTQYYEEWLTKGIPDPRAQLVYVSSGVKAGEILVFRWHKANDHFPEVNKPNSTRID